MGLHDEIDPAIRRLAAGETLFAAGDETRGFFEVRTGRVRLMRFGADGRETALFCGYRRSRPCIPISSRPGLPI
ncbi:cyclic nucleotide-binding domain-containing protein [Bosea sp. (in: a-proteobacteria)]|uniref:cyclic nucleotide-binding domain-containing protein n=1 Tax=Bosea sp. (in: a-proteobacteria) TaxID=1871050 RepID=UPI003523FBEF